MNNVQAVKNYISSAIQSGVPLQEIAWNAALMCVGWPYVYGAVGEECRHAKRAQYGTKFYPKDHETIVTKCRAISWDGTKAVISGTCSGCQWDLPVLMFDCRGFTRKILQMVFGWTLQGGTVGGQWNDSSNWKAKGTVDSIPDDILVCLFVYSKEKCKWMHTGFGFKGQSVECSAGVETHNPRKKKWTHWGIPACIDQEPPQPTPGTDKPTLRRGDKGPYVTLAQTELIQKGYSCGSFGADGEFGKATETAVKEFQRDHKDENGKPLTVDGVIGPKTWYALDGAEPATKYTVTIHGLTESQADALVKQYPGAEKTEERG